jgi:hypothetical protein
MTDEPTLQKVRAFLRGEALNSGNPDVYKSFLLRSSDSKVWPAMVNGQVIGVAITTGSTIDLFYVKKGEERSHTMIANYILADMAHSGYVVAWVAETDRENSAFWESVGFRPKGKGLFTHTLLTPVDLSKIKGSKKHVAVRFYDRSVSADEPFAEMEGVGILSDQKVLYLPELALAFDGRPETNVGRRWVSVFIDGDLQVEARFDTAKAKELGMQRDFAGTPFIAMVDLYTPTLL